MKRKVFDLVRYILSTICIIAIFCFSYLILSKSFKSEDINEEVSFHNLPENTMEVMVVGSSHAQYSFAPAFFYQETGLYSYVMGTQCQPFDASYLMLKEILKTQSPKVLVMEVFTSMPLRNTCDGVGCYITAGYEMRGEERYESFKKLPEEKYETYINPFISLHNDWRTSELSNKEVIGKIKETFSLLDNENEKEFSKVSNMFGFLDNYPPYPVENSWYPFTTDEYIDVELRQVDLDSLNNIYSLCQENNIELVLYKTPMDSLDVENLSYLKKVWDWADERGVKYVDFIKEAESLDFQMWIQSDSFHSFMNGASIITSRLADVINEKQIEHTVNNDLEELYYDAGNWLTVSYLHYEYDPTKYFKRMINFEGPMLIIYNGENVKSRTIKNFLDKYEITSPSVVLVDNEEIVDRSDTCVGIEYKGINVYADFSKIDINSKDVYGVDCGLIVIPFNTDMTNHYLLETNLSKTWKNGFHWYGE